MTIQKLTPDDIETFTLETNPLRTFSSSSTGLTGTVRVFARGSSVEKEVQPLSQFSASFFTDKDLNEFIRNAKTAATASSNIFNHIDSYMDAVNSQSISLRKQQEVEIIRFEPTFHLTSNTVRKTHVVNQLMQHYRNVYPSAHFNYTNYHSLNFFTASIIPNQSAILYPNSGTNEAPMGYYAPTGAFSFDFWINPRYKGEPDNNFKAGTILHLSSCYAVSLVTGSQKDENGYPYGFRILVQFSHSADISPSLATTGAYPNNLNFFSDDNSLQRNHWHHVTIRWGTNTYNLGSGSIVIDGETKGTFIIPSSTLAPGDFTASDEPKLLVMGNYYQGTNTGTETQALFFTSDVAARDGIMELVPGTEEAPDIYLFDHPLNAEIHDVKIYNKYLIDTEVSGLRHDGPSSIDNLIFYVPPFFTAESPTRTFVGDHGGILITPFEEKDGSTADPFNIEFSYGVGGHYINLENFTKDFAQGIFPRLFVLTASAITGSAIIPTTANDYLYHTGSNIRRNVTILPCDNGIFYPNFEFLQDGSYLRDLTTGEIEITGSTVKFKNDLDNFDYGSITLRNLAPSSSYRTGLLFATGSMFNDIAGARPDNLSASQGAILTVLQRTRDNTSNQVVFFDISNLFYGKEIKPGTLVLTDTSYTGSDSKIPIVLKDDGLGNLYRANTLTEPATWNSVGNVFYNEGIVIIKSPHLFFFGKDQFNIQFQGVQDVHILTFNLIAKPSQVTSSSNPSFMPVSASENANDTDQRFVYINGIYLHDDNLNVISKTQFAQPIIKKSGDKITFKVKMDF